MRQLDVVLGEHAHERFNQRTFSSFTYPETVKVLKKHFNKGLLSWEAKEIRTGHIYYPKQGASFVVREQEDSDMFYSLTYRSEIFRSRGKPEEISVNWYKRRD